MALGECGGPFVQWTPRRCHLYGHGNPGARSRTLIAQRINSVCSACVSADKPFDNRLIPALATSTTHSCDTLEDERNAWVYVNIRDCRVRRKRRRGTIIGMYEKRRVLRLRGVH